MGEVEGNVTIRGPATIRPEKDRILVKGSITCVGDVIFEGDVEALFIQASRGEVVVKGSLKVAGTVTVKNGSITVEKDLEAERVRVDRELVVKGETRSREIAVGGRARLNKATVESINVGGTLEAEELHAEKVGVGGVLNCGRLEAGVVRVGGRATLGEAAASRIDVGGTLEAESCTINDKLDVGGAARIRGRLEGGNVAVGGSLSLASATRIRSISVGGRASADGDLEAERVSVGGTLEVGGQLKVVKLSVGGRASVGGNLSAEDKVSVGGALHVKSGLISRSISVGGELTARFVKAEEAHVSKLMTVEGAWVEDVHIKERGVVRGPLSSKLVYMERSGSAETVYADKFECEENCRVNKLYVNEAYISADSLIEELYYAGVVNVDPKARVGKMVKVESIEHPRPPSQ